MNPVSDQRVLEFLRTEAKVRRWIEDVAKVSLVGEDLLYALKDGVVLCQLMLEVDPNSIPRVQVLFVSCATCCYLQYMFLEKYED